MRRVKGITALAGVAAVALAAGGCAYSNVQPALSEDAITTGHGARSSWRKSTPG